jgi:hypothetical protein
MSRGAGTRVAVLLSLLVSALFTTALLGATGGRFAPPLSDLYVVCQYARALAEGHPFRYHAGEPPSSGATSVLHTAWLALGFRIGFRGEGLVAFAMATGAALFALTTACAARLAARLGGDAAGLAAGLLVALGGPVAWGFLYGSDIALFLFLATLLFERLCATWGQPAAASALAAASLLALARPEGLAIALALGAAWALRGGGVRSFLPAAIGAALAAGLRVLTGSWLPSSSADKSLVAAYGWDGALALMSEYVVDVVRGLLLGFYPSQAPVGLARGWSSLAFPPLGLVLVAAALLRAGAPARLWAGVVGLVWLLGTPNVFLGVHFNRYLLWAFPSLLVLVALGLERALPPRAARAALALFLVLGAASTLRFALLNAEMAGELARRELPAAAFIAARLPPEAAVANAATSVEYLSGRRSVNLHGVTTPAFFGGRSAEREASMLEAIGRLPAAERPAYLLTSERAQESQPTLRALASGPPLFRSAAFSDDELLLFATSYAAFDAARRPQGGLRDAIAGRREVDSLNVGDARDEDAHVYRVRSDVGDLRLHAGTRVAPNADGVALADAGRAVLGEESFELRVTPGRELVLVLRTAPELVARVLRPAAARGVGVAFDEAWVELSVDGRPAGGRRFRPASGWDEIAFEVPGESIRSERLAVRLVGRYASFRYWAFQ